MNTRELVDVVGLEGIHKHSSNHLGEKMVVVAQWKLGVVVAWGWRYGSEGLITEVVAIGMILFRVVGSSGSMSM
jgi:hypothetical protein